MYQPGFNVVNNVPGSRKSPCLLMATSSASPHRQAGGVHDTVRPGNVKQNTVPRQPRSDCHNAPQQRLEAPHEPPPMRLMSRYQY